ncbi:MAG: hypothetical protein M1380_01295 [Chloroflexi bacterium]|nr:hypothetical protein [Chloroflexota bacterium]
MGKSRKRVDGLAGRETRPNRGRQQDARTSGGVSLAGVAADKVSRLVYSAAWSALALIAMVAVMTMPRY